MRSFVKSADTTTSVDNSRAELNKVLSRYGCTAFGYDQDSETGLTRVTFRVPDSTAKDAPKVPVQLEVRVRDVYARLYPPAPKNHYVGREWIAAEKYSAKGMAQAERVAWRHLVLWVDAACTAAGAGMTTMREAFHANVLVVDTNSGKIGRLSDFVKGLEQGGALALPAAGQTHG